MFWTVLTYKPYKEPVSAPAAVKFLSLGPRLLVYFKYVCSINKDIISKNKKKWNPVL